MKKTGATIRSKISSNMVMASFLPDYYLLKYFDNTIN